MALRGRFFTMLVIFTGTWEQMRPLSNSKYASPHAASSDLLAVVHRALDFGRSACVYLIEHLFELDLLDRT